MLTFMVWYTQTYVLTFDPGTALPATMALNNKQVDTPVKQGTSTASTVRLPVLLNARMVKACLRAGLDKPGTASIQLFGGHKC